MNEIVKSAAGSFLKNLAKWGLAIQGVPVVVGGTVVDTVAAVGGNFLQNPNDKAVAEMVQGFEAQVLEELKAKADEYNDKRPPSPEDVHEGLMRFVRTYREARNHKKRRVLFNAFFNSFQPGFYDEAVSKILWDKVERLEYPDFFFLHRMLRAIHPQYHDIYLPSFRVEEHPPIRILDSDVAQIELHLPHAEFAERLARESLLHIQEDGPKHARLRLRGFAVEMRDFALREAWRAESAESTLDGEGEPERPQ